MIYTVTCCLSEFSYNSSRIDPRVDVLAEEKFLLTLTNRKGHHGYSPCNHCFYELSKIQYVAAVLSQTG